MENQLVAVTATQGLVPTKGSDVTRLPLFRLPEPLMPNLNQIQRWMQAVITHPDGAAEGVAAAREIVDVGPEVVEQLVTRSHALSGMERLGIYATAYYSRLLECLREEFPALIHALGEETFDAFAFGYLQKYPSRSYTLSQLAAHFPRYLAESRDEWGDEDADFRAWQDFLIDLATLEWTISDVFDGPGEEGSAPLNSDHISTIPSEHWPQARLVPARSLRLLTFQYPVHEYYLAVRNGENPSVPRTDAIHLAVTRADFVVRQHVLSPTEYDLLQALILGDTVEAAIAKIVASETADLDNLAANLREWFSAWTAKGFFREVVFAE
jgi:hypothetical protein